MVLFNFCMVIDGVRGLLVFKRYIVLRNNRGFVVVVVVVVVVVDSCVVVLIPFFLFLNVQCECSFFG